MEPGCLAVLHHLLVRIERVFYIFVLVYGLVLGTCFVSSCLVWRVSQQPCQRNTLIQLPWGPHVFLGFVARHHHHHERRILAEHRSGVTSAFCFHGGSLLPRQSFNAWMLRCGHWHAITPHRISFWRSFWKRTLCHETYRPGFWGTFNVFPFQSDQGVSVHRKKHIARLQDFCHFRSFLGGMWITSWNCDTRKLTIQRFTTCSCFLDHCIGSCKGRSTPVHWTYTQLLAGWERDMTRTVQGDLFRFHEAIFIS